MFFFLPFPFLLVFLLSFVSDWLLFLCSGCSHCSAWKGLGVWLLWVWLGTGIFLCLNTPIISSLSFFSLFSLLFFLNFSALLSCPHLGSLSPFPHLSSSLSPLLVVCLPHVFSSVHPPNTGSLFAASTLKYTRVHSSLTLGAVRGAIFVSVRVFVGREEGGGASRGKRENAI